MSNSRWIETTLGDLATVRRGASPRPIASPRWFDASSEVRWVRIADVNRSDGRLLTSTTQALSPDGVVRSRYLEPGTLIMSIAATVGVPVITAVQSCIHDGFVSLQRLQADQQFLLYLLKSSEHLLREAGQSGSQTNINSDIVREFEVRIPASKEEQKRIGTTLWETDDLISSLDAVLRKQRDIKQGLMQELLSGRTRLPGFAGEWVDTQLGSVLKFQAGFPFESRYFATTPRGVRLVRNRDLRADDSITFYEGPYSADYVLRSGDVLVGMDGDFEPVIWRSEGALLNQRVGRLRASSQVSSAYLAYALWSPLKELQASTGATTVKHLSHSDVEKMTLSLPGVVEQQAIAEVLLDADKEISALERQLESARAIKEGMMQELLTGRTRLVPEVAS
ncbi:restriction endonuclease subunit S [Schaalia sp. JY-X169]|uniref:restriction endonuclease subunit S n=1 Tax=Schaalia sp. JY-X169 TaxID=2758572 RepID=UPI0015F48CA6|nr:restriction endonuclease subunit S [Schaalia sp. JY-X169]